MDSTSKVYTGTDVDQEAAAEMVHWVQERQNEARAAQAMAAVAALAGPGALSLLSRHFRPFRKGKPVHEMPTEQAGVDTMNQAEDRREARRLRNILLGYPKAERRTAELRVARGDR